MNLSENFSNSFDYVKKLFSDIGRLIILIILDHNSFRAIGLYWVMQQEC